MIHSTSSTTSARSRSRAARALLTLLVAGAAMSVLPRLAPTWWLADLCSHFAVQLAAFGLFVMVICTLRRRWIFASAAFVVLAINLWALAPLFVSPSAVQIRSNAALPAFRIVFANVYYRNPDVERISRFLRDTRADVAVLAEVMPAWKARLEPLERDFPYTHYSYLPGQRRTGVLLLSRWPINKATTLEFGRTGDPGVFAELNINSRMLHLIGVHPTWPLWRVSTLNRNAQFGRIAALARDAGASTVVIGDFNATAFSPAFNRFVTASGLVSAARGRGWLPTWPTLFTPLGIQIDQALVSPDLQVVEFKRGPRIGSDHLPIAVEILSASPTRVTE